MHSNNTAELQDSDEFVFIKPNENALKNMIKLISIPTHIPLKIVTRQHNANFIRYACPQDSTDRSIPINETDFTEFRKCIQETKNEFIYPMIFVNVAKHHIQLSSRKPLFSSEHLRELQLWGNQYRSLITDDSNDGNSTSERSDYLLYIIAVRAICFLANDAKSTINV